MEPANHASAGGTLHTHIRCRAGVVATKGRRRVDAEDHRGRWVRRRVYRWVRRERAAMRAPTGTPVSVRIGCETGTSMSVPMDAPTSTEGVELSGIKARRQPQSLTQLSYTDSNTYSVTIYRFHYVPSYHNLRSVESVQIRVLSELFHIQNEYYRNFTFKIRIGENFYI